ncbi:MAG TPA: hypothetical protein VMP68_31525, partial [Candidatus Eisenbacteria bacterium]|nr:hypothetical protein [Candidatus Eisenbacteria bacterium]
MIENLLTTGFGHSDPPGSPGDLSGGAATTAANFFNICQTLLCAEGESVIPQIPTDPNSQGRMPGTVPAKASSLKLSPKEKDDTVPDSLQSLSAMLGMGTILIPNPVVQATLTPNDVLAFSQKNFSDVSADLAESSIGIANSFGSSPSVSQTANLLTQAQLSIDPKADLSSGGGELQALLSQTLVECSNGDISSTSTVDQSDLPSCAPQANRLVDAAPEPCLQDSVENAPAQSEPAISDQPAIPNTSFSGNDGSAGITTSMSKPLTSSQLPGDQASFGAKNAKPDSPRTKDAETPHTSSVGQQINSLQNTAPHSCGASITVLDLSHLSSIHTAHPPSRNMDAENGVPLGPQGASGSAATADRTQPGTDSASSIISRLIQATSTIPAANPPLVAPSAVTEIASGNAKPGVSQDHFSLASAQLPELHSASTGDRTGTQNTVDPTPVVSKRSTQEDDAASAPAPPPQVLPFISNPAANVSDPTISNPVSAKAASPEKLASGEPALNQHLEPQLSSTVSAGPVQLAHIMNKAAQSEMRIGLSTSVFGDVEVRTVVHASDVGVVIGSQKGDLQMLMSNDLPSISGHLLQQNLH